MLQIDPLELQSLAISAFNQTYQDHPAATSIEEAINILCKTLPDWWWSIGNCNISADASCGPINVGKDAYLLKHTIFDNGFHFDDVYEPGNIPHPAKSLLIVMLKGIIAKQMIKNTSP